MYAFDRRVAGCLRRPHFPATCRRSLSYPTHRCELLKALRYHWVISTSGRRKDDTAYLSPGKQKALKDIDIHWLSIVIVEPSGISSQPAFSAA
jgi:hypothetical protein